MKIEHIAKSAGVRTDMISGYEPGWIEELERLLLVEKAVEALVVDLVEAFKTRWGGAWAENHNPLQVQEVTRIVCDRVGLDWRDYL